MTGPPRPPGKRDRPPRSRGPGAGRHDGPPRRGAKARPPPAPKAPGRQALAHVGGEVSAHGDPAASAILRKALEAQTGELDLTHPFHTYPARMHPGVARVLLAELERPAGLVVDPFCGSGTTLVEALRAGAASVGNDLNPIAVRLAAVKTRLPDDAGLERWAAATLAVQTASEERVKARRRARAPLPEKLRQLYPAHVLLELAGLLDEIAEVPGDEERAALAMVFSSLVVKFSLLRGDTGGEREDKRIGRFVPTRFFARKAAELAEQWRALRTVVPAGTPPPRIVEGDARALPRALGRDAGLVLSSPPYGGTYDYQAHHELRLRWLGLDEQAFSRGEVGARRALSEGDATPARARWDDEVLDVLRAIRACAVAGAPVALLVGDGEVGGERVDADEQLRRLAPKAGLRWTATASQPRPDWRGGRGRREHLVLLHQDPDAQPEEPAPRRRQPTSRPSRPVRPRR